MTQSVKNPNRISLFIVIFLTSFLLGVILSFSIGENTNNSLLKTLKKANIKELITNKEDLDMTKFWEVYSIIKSESYNQDVSKQELVDSAVKGLVEGLGDKHSEYFSEENTKRFNESLSGDFEGIGAFVEKNQLGITLERIIKGSPAKKYWLRAGDIVIKANGVVLADLDLIDGVSHIKGPSGSKVTLEILRAGEQEILTIDVIRKRILIPSVDSEIFEDNIGYISVNQFGDNTVEEFSKALKSMKDTQGIIIDLRDNGGWYLQSAVLMLSEFIPEWETLVVVKHKEFYKNIAYPSVAYDEIFDKKIVVLINENSASASEIMAGALRDYDKAILVWKKSYGKGSVQKPFQFSDNSMVKVTIANWYTPKNKNIDKEGIVPDIEVLFKKEDFENTYDRQLEESKKVLNRFIKLGSLQLTVDEFNTDNK